MTRWLDETEMRAWRNFVELAREIEAAVDEDLAAFGLNHGDYEVFVCLSEAEESRMRMCDLAAGLHLTPSGLTRRLDGLVRAGYVAREPSTADRRVTMAVLTPNGTRLLERVAPTHVDFVRREFLDQLAAHEIETLGNALAALRRRRASAVSATFATN